jgi:hypothetical protein
MPHVATPARRRIVMASLLALAVAGAVVRTTAPNPSVLRDVGTLLLVLWLPAVGNLIAWLIRKIPRKAARVTDFAAGSAFTEHLRAQVDVLASSPQLLAAWNPHDARCTLVAGHQAFTARLPAPAAEELAHPGERLLRLELLRPDASLQHLAPGTEFHLMLGPTAAAKGRVVA